MRMSAFAVFAAFAAALAVAAGCSGDGGSPEGAGAQDQGDSMVIGRSGGRSAVGNLDLAGMTGGSGVLPGITVVGTGSVRAVPDVADWSFGVQADADTASTALDAASQATRRILDTLREAGLARDDLRTEQVSLYPRTTDDGRSVVGYTASSSVHATIRDVGKAGEVVDAAVAAGANQVSGPTLRVSETRAQYRAALEAALDDARARAEALAAKAGVTLGGPLAIVESGSSPGPVFERLAADVAEAGVPIEPGLQEISATLTVTFGIS